MLILITLRKPLMVQAKSAFFMLFFTILLPLPRAIKAMDTIDETTIRMVVKKTTNDSTTYTAFLSNEDTCKATLFDDSSITCTRIIRINGIENVIILHNRYFDVFQAIFAKKNRP